MKSLQGAPGWKSSDSFKGGLQLKSTPIKNQFKGHQKSISIRYTSISLYSLRAYFSQEVSGRHATYLGNMLLNRQSGMQGKLEKKESEHNKRMHKKVLVSNTFYPLQEISIRATIYVSKYAQQLKHFARADKVYKYYCEALNPHFMARCARCELAHVSTPRPSRMPFFHSPS